MCWKWCAISFNAKWCGSIAGPAPDWPASAAPFDAGAPLPAAAAAGFCATGAAAAVATAGAAATAAAGCPAAPAPTGPCRRQHVCHRQAIRLCMPPVTGLLAATAERLACISSAAAATSAAMPFCNRLDHGRHFGYRACGQPAGRCRTVSSQLPPWRSIEFGAVRQLSWLPATRSPAGSLAATAAPPAVRSEFDCAMKFAQQWSTQHVSM